MLIYRCINYHYGMDTDTAKTPRLRIKPASVNAGWRSLWNWLLRPSDDGVAAGAKEPTDIATSKDAGCGQETSLPTEEQDTQDHDK